MMQGEKLRRADFVTSIVLIAFSLWVLSETLKMPMRDTFGGVQNVWYVSPALFPLFISIALCVFGIILLAHSIRSGGFHSFITLVQNRGAMRWDGIVRFGAILLALAGYVYLSIPRTDFFLATATFLFYFLSAFHFDDDAIMRRAAAVYALTIGTVYLIFATGLAGLLNSGFVYTTDVIALGFLVGLIVTVRSLVISRGRSLQQFRIVTLITFVVPLFLLPVFRYFLRVPLPREGGIIEIMHIIYYGLR